MTASPSTTVRRPASVDHWLGSVKLTRRIPFSVRMALDRLGPHIDPATFLIRYPRAEFANDLGISVRTVNRYMAAACVAGYLAPVTRGHKGVTAVYRATLPAPDPSEDGRRLRAI